MGKNRSNKEYRGRTSDKAGGYPTRSENADQLELANFPKKQEDDYEINNRRSRKGT